MISKMSKYLTSDGTVRLICHFCAIFCAPITSTCARHFKCSENTCRCENTNQKQHLVRRTCGAERRRKSNVEPNKQPRTNTRPPQISRCMGPVSMHGLIFGARAVRVFKPVRVPDPVRVPRPGPRSPTASQVRPPIPDGVPEM